MKKISILYQKDPNDLRRVIDKVNPENAWVFEVGIPTRKFDGTSCAIIGGALYKRFDLKKGRKLPPNAIPCQPPDPTSGHYPHWVRCDRTDKANQWHFEAFDQMDDPEDGTYELCGEKVQGNPEGITGHQLIKHGRQILDIQDFSFATLKNYLHTADMEGIVFHHPHDGRMCKIRQSDFGIKR